MENRIVSPELEEIALAARAEMRAEAEEAERDAAVLSAMRRSLREACLEMMHRGDTVSVEAGPWTFGGVLSHVSEDLASLPVPGGQVDLNLRAVSCVSVIRRSRRGGRRASPDAAPSLRARLLELQTYGSRVEAGILGGRTFDGRLRAVGTDHILVSRGEAECFIPLRALAFVRSSVRSSSEAYGR